MVTDIQQALETIFSADSQLYQQRGFQRRIGFGTRPALIHIDLANALDAPGQRVQLRRAWTRSSPACSG